MGDDMPLSELNQIAAQYTQVLTRMRRHYADCPNLRDEQLLVAMFVLESLNSDSVADLDDSELFALTGTEIASFDTVNSF
jgi:hypothetical protein